MPRSKQIINSVVTHLKEYETNRDERATHGWFSTNERLSRIEFILIRSYLLFHVVHDLSSLVMSQVKDLLAKAGWW